MKVLETKKSRIDEIVLHTSHGEGPQMQNMVFLSQELDGCTLFWGEHNGFVMFMADDYNNDMGSAGRVIQIQTENGVRTIRGPWSSRASVMNRFFQPSKEVIIVEAADDLCGIASAMTIEALERLGLRFERIERRGEVHYDLI